MTQFYSRNDVKYNGDVYSIPFDYIKEQEIQVYLDDVLFTDWSFLQKSQIKFNKIPSGITNKTIVSVRRVTDISKKEVDYSNNTLLDKASLNTSQDQLLHAVQEIYDNNIEFQDETTAQVAAFEARVEEVEATTAESANIVAESAVLSASALANSEQAVTTANSAYDTATEALLTSEQANSFATEARDSATIALDIAVTSGNKVDVFEESIETVLEAADKITVLEGAVGEATEAAQAAQEAVQAVGEMIDAIDGKANVDLDNLSEVGQAKLDEKANINLSNLTPEAQAKLDVKANAADVLDKSQITNCLLEVPQRIKYTLVDGTLTIKAGSVVIYPFGTEDLTAQYPKGATFLNDNLKVYDTQFVDGKFFVWAEKVNDAAYGKTVGTMANRVLWSNEKGTSSSIGLEYCFSGTTAPTGSTTLWYDTTQNIIKRTTDSGATWTPNQSFLLIRGAYTKDYGFNTIDQIFNGMGYIGSTIWVDKGVKGLAPNGRNADGTLNNREFTTDKVLTYTSGKYANSRYITLSATAVNIPYRSYYSYDSFNNINLVQGGRVVNAVVGSLNTDDNGVISNFQPKQPFRAVDYNDFDTKVNKSGDTMTGNLTIDNAKQAIITIDSDLAGLGSSPSGGANTGSIYFKQQGVLTAIIQNAVMESGANRLQLITRKPDNSGWGAGVNLITSATGASTFDFPRCTTKATTTSTASGSSVAVITQNYKNGNSWYRVWSDGWIEQGGSFGEEYLSYAVKTFTFLKSFSDANYNVQATNGATGSFYCPALQSKTKTNFQLRDTVNYAGLGNWYACGY